MSASSPDQIRRLAELIARELVATSSAGSPPPSASSGADPGGGVFSKLDDAVAAASAAFRALDALSLEKRHAIIGSMREALRAGRYVAARATTNNAMAAPANAVKSVAVTP